MCVATHSILFFRYILKEIMEGNKKSGKIEIEVRHLERQLHQNFPMVGFFYIPFILMAANII